MAATWVMLFHFRGLASLYFDQVPFLRPVLAAGWTGVELFFVLSGFVITLAYGDQVGSRPGPAVVGHFLLNRFARVWPAWAAVTVLTGGWLWTLRRIGWDTEILTPHPAADLPTLVRQLSMTQVWGHGGILNGSWVIPGWSISAEWAAYLAFPLVAVLVRPVRRLPAAVLLSLAVAAMLPLAVASFTTGALDHEESWALRIACAFTAGVLTALATRRIRNRARAESMALGLTCWSLFAVLAGIAWASWRQAGDVAHDYSGVIVAVFPLLVFGLATTDRGPARWLSCNSLVYGGRLSYCLYLVHWVVIDVLITVWWQPQSARGVMSPGLALAVPGAVLLAFLASAALHHGVEEPARRAILAVVDRSVALVRPRTTARVAVRVVRTVGMDEPVSPRTERLAAVGAARRPSEVARSSALPPVGPRLAGEARRPQIVESPGGRRRTVGAGI